MLEGAQHPDRDAQFRSINTQVTAALDAGEPVISIDTKKVALTRKQSAALGQVCGRSEVELSELAAAPTAEQVALNLTLPIVQSLPIKEILSLREHEAAKFHAFRNAIRVAITERLKALPNADAYQVAESVYEDVIEPALVALDRKVNKAANLFGKSLLTTVAVGSVVATVGLLAFAPIVAPGIVIAAGGTLAH